MSEREQARRRRFRVFMAEYYAARQAILHGPVKPAEPAERAS